MRYSLYRLEFTTGLHIGVDRGGQSLDDGRMTIHSDTLFSAMCCECAKRGDIDRLYGLFSEGKITVSDCLPYKNGDYYFPRPVLHTGKSDREGRPEARKALKSVEYIPVSVFDAFLKDYAKKEVDADRLKYDFGGLISHTRVAVKGQPQPMPYQVAFWRFAPGCGLYVIVRYEDESSLSFFEEVLNALGLSGIGGKQSSGLGKFNVVKAPLPDKMEELLEDVEADYHMLLGTALPEEEELDEVLSGSWYATLRRGGFVRSETYSVTQLKKRTIYMLAPGSCMKRRFDGGMFDLSDGGTHPVWRCGKTLFAGVRL